MSEDNPVAFKSFNRFPQENLIPNSSEQSKKAPKGYGSSSTTVDVEAEFGGSSEKKGSTLSVHKIQYQVDVSTRPCCGTKVKKRILKDIDAVFHQGMNAILGPTGSGKSSFLDVLAGRKDPHGLTGTILIDGQPPPDNFKCMVGYVVQDDVVMGTLSVKENFQFSASLRLGKHVSKSERNRRVDQVVEELGLTSCADVKVGNEFIRGISGGERKRTNIGMELIISPPVLFLDEPTTGLDANTANSVMHLLKRMAMRGRTIVFSIHQPRYSIYRLFDSLILLSLGEAVYQGPAREALDYFTSIGYICEEHNNPPDFFLDVVNGDADGTELSETPNKNSNGGKDVHEYLVKNFKSSQWFTILQKDLGTIYTSYEGHTQQEGNTKVERVKYATSFLRQLAVVSGRTVKNLIRNPQTSIMQLLVMVIFGVVVGGIYYQLDDSLTFGIKNRVGAFFFIIMNQVFGNLSAVELFIKERAIFRHENVGGFYRVSSYFFAKIFCDIIPMRLFPVVVFGTITYWMIGFQYNGVKFLIYVLNLFLTTMAASGLAFFISASVRIFAVANLLIALCYVFMMVFSGFLISLDSIASWIRWLQYFSIFRYSLNALSINELKNMEFCAPNSTICASGNSYLAESNIPYATDWDLWQNSVALGSMSFILLTFAYIQLLVMKKLR